MLGQGWANSALGVLLVLAVLKPLVNYCNNEVCNGSETRRGRDRGVRQSQTAVTAYLKSEKLLLFAFALQKDIAYDFIRCGVKLDR